MAIMINMADCYPIDMPTIDCYQSIYDQLCNRYTIDRYCQYDQYNRLIYYCYIEWLYQMDYWLIINHMLDDVHSIIDQCTIDNQLYNIHINSSDLIIILIILSTACALAINTIAYLMICNQLSDLQLTDSYHILHVNRCLQCYSTT